MDEPEEPRVTKPMRMPKAGISIYLFLSSIIPAVVSLTIGISLGSIILQARNQEEQKRLLISAGTYIAGMIDESPLGLRDPSIPRALDNFARINEYRVTVILPDGSVLADTAVHDRALENHASREEVKAALSGRVGFSVRRSATTGLEYLYAAQPLRQKNAIAAVVRVAKAAGLLRHEQLDIVWEIVGIGLIFLLASILVSSFISTIFGRFVKRMSDAAEKMAKGSFDLRVTETHISELNKLADALNGMAERIGKSIEDLVSEKRELEKTRDELQKAVDLREWYLKELQHRVKNNLALISSLLNLEYGKIADTDAQQVFKEMSTRVDTVARIYEFLYKSADMESVDLKPYLENLAASISRAYAHQSHRFSINTAIAPLRVDSKIAVPMGLILTECLTNSFKYAFPPPREGRVIVGLTVDEHEFVLTISDDGVGFPPGFKPDSSSTLGLQLVRMLAAQLKARLAVSGEGGVSVTLGVDHHGRRS